ncbi:hypothetical protein KSP39_PZI022783 [Platanthera zijinensis]|uniref:CCHC-type domain-containing protein n=1 Tax=Platanthera zijinensis TaxID=2320716 RepID=A0AAP0FUB6_9ASPA
MCLPSTWDSRIWPIKDSRSQTETSTEALLGKLKSYELFVKNREGEQNITSSAPKVEKTIALKASEEVPKEKEIGNEELLSLLAKRFNKMARKNFRRWSSKDQDKPRYDRSNNKDITCYGCRKPGHIAPNCPENQGKDKKDKKDKRERRDKKRDKDSKKYYDKSPSSNTKHTRKGFVAETWSDTEESEESSSTSDDEDDATEKGFCMMAINASQSSSDSEHESEYLTDQELSEDQVSPLMP